MDILPDLLKQLASSLSPTEFVVVLCIIAATSFVVVSYIMKNVRAKSGMWSFLDEPEDEPVELKDVKDAVQQLVDDNSKQHSELTAASRQILAAIQEARAEDRERMDAVIKYLEEISALENLLMSTKKDILKQIEDLQHQSRTHETHDLQTHAAMRQSLESTLGALSKINAQLEKVDEYVKAVVPEFKQAHRELSKDISTLSRDVALVERSVQSQINTVNAVTLR